MMSAGPLQFGQATKQSIDGFPAQIGMVAGLFFGFSFGMGGIGAAVPGALADAAGIGFVYRVCAFLPALGSRPRFCRRSKRAA